MAPSFKEKLLSEVAELKMALGGRKSADHAAELDAKAEELASLWSRLAFAEATARTDAGPKKPSRPAPVLLAAADQAAALVPPRGRSVIIGPCTFAALRDGRGTSLRGEFKPDWRFLVVAGVRHPLHPTESDNIRRVPELSLADLLAGAKNGNLRFA